MAKGTSNIGGNLFDDESQKKKKFRQSVETDELKLIELKKERIKLEQQEEQSLREQARLQVARVRQTNEEYKNLLRLRRLQADGLNFAQQQRLEELQRYNAEYNQNVKRRKEIRELRKQETERYAEFQKSITASEEFEDIQRSIVGLFGDQTNIAKELKIILDEQKTTLKTAASIIDTMTNADQKKAAIQASEAYKKQNNSIANAARELERSKITQEEYNSIVKTVNEEFELILSSLEQMGQDGKDLSIIFKKGSKSVKEFYEGAEKSKKILDSVNTAIDALGSSGIPLINNLADVVKNKLNKNLEGTKMAIRALGVAAGVLATKYIFADKQVEIEQYNQRLQNAIDLRKKFAEIDVQFGGQKVGEPNFIQKQAFIDVQKNLNDLRKSEIENIQKIGNIRNDIDNERRKAEIDHLETVRKLEIDRDFTARKSANAFSATLQQSAVQFEAASKTALFGNKLGSVKYGAAQLQIAGISADKIAESLKTAGNIMGAMPSNDIAVDMAIISERTGASSESIASIQQMFTNLDGVSQNTAINLQEGMRAMADSLKIPLDSYMNEVAEASKDMLSYNIKSGPALLKQVAAAKSLGISFMDIAKAGQNMVLNYKDSIKSEMQLSALLGKQVDLSEVRAKFAAGDTTGALKALQDQGLDPTEMDMFQQQALQQATGLDSLTLQKIARGEIKEPAELKEGQAGAANKSFLGRKVEAERVMEAKNAMISANQAIIDEKLSYDIIKKQLDDPILSDLRKQRLEQELRETKTNAELQRNIINALASDPTYQNQLKTIAQLEAEYHREFQDALSRSTDYLNALADEKRLNIEKTFSENALDAVGGILGGIAADFIARRVGRGLGRTFGTRGRTPSATTTPNVPATTVSRTTTSTNAQRARIPRGQPGAGRFTSTITQTPTTTAVPTTSGTGMASRLGGSSIGKALGKVGKGSAVLAVLGAGLEYSGRKSEGQTTTQAAVGTTASTLGALGGAAAGAKLGAVIGTFIAPGIGTAIGGALGGLAGSVAGAFASSKIADKLTGVNKVNQTSVSTEANPKTAENKTEISLTMLSNMQSILQQMKVNDDKRGILMYQKQKDQNANLDKIVVRTHGTSQQLEYANLNYYPKLLNMTKNIQSLNEATVDLLVQLVQSAKVTPQIEIDGKVLNKKLYNIDQNYRVTGTNAK